LGGGIAVARLAGGNVVLELYELTAEIVGYEGWCLVGGEAETIPGVLFDPVVDCADTYSECIGDLLLGEGLVDIELEGLFLLVCKGHSFWIFSV
jgi:hypothetical protein